MEQPTTPSIPFVTMATRVHAGPMLREWRVRRHLSQLDLSSRTGVSTRHLSCVETGRAKPSRELLLYLAEELDVPRRATNELLLAAGFAPVFTEHALDDEAMASVREVVDLVLRGNDPNPTTVIDTRWNLINANAAALWLAAGASPELLTPPINIARLSLHPGGLAPRITNFAEFSAQLLRHMRHTHSVTHDPVLGALIEELAPLCPPAPAAPTGPEVILPFRLRMGAVELSFLSTVTAFGTALDVTLSELSIETLYPADATTATVLAARPWLT